MLNSTIKPWVAGALISVLLMQIVLASVVCPGLVHMPITSLIEGQPPVAWSACNEGGAGIGLLKAKLRHERYISVNALDIRALNLLNFASTQSAPLAKVLRVKVAASWRVPLLAELLERATAPPISVQFQVLRI